MHNPRMTQRQFMALSYPRTSEVQTQKRCRVWQESLAIVGMERPSVAAAAAIAVEGAPNPWLRLSACHGLPSERRYRGWRNRGSVWVGTMVVASGGEIPSPFGAMREARAAIHGFRDACAARRHRSTRGYKPRPLRGQLGLGATEMEDESLDGMSPWMALPVGWHALMDGMASWISWQGHRQLQDGATIQVPGGNDGRKNTPRGHAFDAGFASAAAFTCETAGGCEWPRTASKAWNPWSLRWPWGAGRSQGDPAARPMRVGGRRGWVQSTYDIPSAGRRGGAGPRRGPGFSQRRQRRWGL
jgi:hypothetical protein